MSDGSSHQEPFLINAATGSAASVGYQREESKDDAGPSPANAPRRGSTLRRRFRRRERGQPKSEPAGASNEESKYGDVESQWRGSDSKEDDVTEAKEEGTPSKSPRHPAPAIQPPVEVTNVNAPEERKAPPRLSLKASLPSLTNKERQETKAPSRPSLKAPLPAMHHSSYIRKPDEKLREKLKTRLRSVADGIPEVHFIGEITEGAGFKDSYVSCKWYLEWGKSWSFLAGEESSQTQYSAQDDDGVQVFNHPIDAHFAAASMQGWPRIIMQVWELDEYGRSILSGYGFAHLPTNPGCHELEVRCWRPSGSMREELESFFLGTSSCVVDENVIFGKAWEKRSQLVTVSSGVVKMNVNVILRFFNEQKVA